jgi:hypothetical protein
LRTFLAVIFGIAFMTLAIYNVMRPTEPPPVISIATHGVSLGSAKHLGYTRNNAEELEALLRLHSELSASNDLLLSFAFENISNHDILEAITLAEHSYVEELIATNDAKRRQELVILIRQTRSYRKTLLSEDADNPPNKEDRLSAESSLAATARQRARDPSLLLSDDSAENSLPLVKTEAEAIARSTSSPKPVLKERYQRARNRFYDDLFDNPQKVLFPLLFSVLYFLVIVAGILTGSIYEALGKMDGTRKISFRQVLRKAGTPGTWQGILASPIVFAVVIMLVPKDAFSLPMAFLAYQNGFFWRATLQKFAEVKEARKEAKEVAT